MTDKCPRNYADAFLDLSDFTEVAKPAELQQGKTATIYERKKDRQRFFIKVISDVFGNPDQIKRFLREIDSQIYLAHDSFSVFRGFAIESKEPPIQDVSLFFQHMPMSLSQFIHLEGEDDVMEVTDAACIVYGLAVLIEYMHKRKYAHRDIKPDNVLIDEDFRPWVTDFDWSRSLDETTDDVTTHFGTQNFQGPELLLGALTMERTFMSDIFALGVVFVHTCIRCAPFRIDPRKQQWRHYDTGKLAEMYKRIVPGLSDEEAEGLCYLDGGQPDLVMLALETMEDSVLERGDKIIQPRLAEIIRKCLKPVPEDRPTATELREQIENLRPEEMVVWDDEYPDEEVLNEYKEKMKKDFGIQ